MFKKSSHVDFKILYNISKTTKGLAFPMCGSSYTVGPQTYIPILLTFIGINFSFLLPKLFDKKISFFIVLEIYFNYRFVNLIDYLGILQTGIGSILCKLVFLILLYFSLFLESSLFIASANSL